MDRSVSKALDFQSKRRLIKSHMLLYKTRILVFLLSTKAKLILQKRKF